MTMFERLTLLLGSSVYTSSPLGVARDSNLMSSGFVSMSMSTNSRSLSAGDRHEQIWPHKNEVLMTDDGVTDD